MGLFVLIVAEKEYTKILFEEWGEAINTSGRIINQEYIDKYLEKYPRHRAFKREVDNALGKSDISR